MEIYFLQEHETKLFLCNYDIVVTFMCAYNKSHKYTKNCLYLEISSKFLK